MISPTKGLEIVAKMESFEPVAKLCHRRRKVHCLEQFIIASNPNMFSELSMAKGLDCSVRFVFACIIPSDLGFEVPDALILAI